MKKKQIKTGVEILISILGLLALYWIDLYAIKIQFSEHLNKFVTVHDEVWFPILNVLVCLMTSYFLGRLFSWSKNTWGLVLVFYLFLLCACVPNLIVANSAVYLSVSFMRSARFFQTILQIKSVIKAISLCLLVVGILLRKQNRHSRYTIGFLFASAILSSILYEFSTFAYAWYFYLGILGILPILYLAMRQNELRIPRGN
ncbi:hypothetical protein [Dubosiella newyorkensis]|uniref:hypothetical protein n=1 Tax=Dubosiella newyorkensis TaxID=1862672 RepID=UPI00248C85CE|nr:hypothetical protein [Dubosiella newyorkensis]